MQILVSDYDGTFNPFYFKPVFDKNIEGVKNFRFNGNLFIISTARKPSQIVNELKMFSISYDYLICSNGNIIFDNNGNVVYINSISESEILLFLDSIQFLYGVKSICYFDFDGKTTCESPYSVQIITRKIIKSTEFIRSDFDIKISVFLTKIKFQHCSNKRDGLLTLLKELKLAVKNPNIYSIGNSVNDIEMLRRFNGYKVPYSNPLLLFDSQIPIVDSVYTLTKKIQSSRKM